MMKYVFKKPVYRVLVPIIDLLGYVVCLPARLLHKKAPQNPKNILVARLDHIGDFVCTTPVFKNLKAYFPGAKITALVNSISKDLALRNPNIDKVISFSPFYLARNESSSRLKGLGRVIKDIKALGFDLGIDPRGDFLSILLMWLGGVKYRISYGITGGGFLLNKACNYDEFKHAIDRNLALLEAIDVPVSHKSPEVYFNGKDEDEVQRLLRSFGVRNGGFIIIHPFAGAKSKEWFKGNFQKIIECFKSKGSDVILVGAKDDIGLFDKVIDFRGKLTLPQLACLIKNASMFIGLDSGPANIAAALNVPSIIICSGTNIPQLWIPDNSNVRLVYKNVDCKPCGLKICRKEKHECIELITVEDVMNAVEDIASVKNGAVPINPE